MIFCLLYYTMAYSERKQQNITFCHLSVIDGSFVQWQDARWGLSDSKPNEPPLKPMIKHCIGLPKCSVLYKVHRFYSIDLGFAQRQYKLQTTAQNDLIIE